MKKIMNLLRFVVRKFFFTKMALLPVILFYTAAYGAVSDYVGVSYYGSFDGNGEQTWLATVKESGEVIFTSFSYNDIVIDGGTLTVDDNGYVSGLTDISGRRIEATIFVANTGSFIRGRYFMADIEGPLQGVGRPIDVNQVGSFSGQLTTADEDNIIGTWSITADPSGYISGSMTFFEDEPVDVEGVFMTYDGWFEFIVYNQSGLGMWVRYDEREDPPIYGIWNNAVADENGWSVGQRDSGPPIAPSETDTETGNETDTQTDADDNGGGGGGGCFIDMLRR